VPPLKNSLRATFKDFVLHIEGFGFLFHRVHNGDAIFAGGKSEPVEMNYPIVVAAPLLGHLDSLEPEDHVQEFIKATARADEIAWDFTIAYNIIALYLQSNFNHINSTSDVELDQILTWCDYVSANERVGRGKAEAAIVRQSIIDYRGFSEPALSESPEHGYVYLAYCSTGHYKIGRSKYPNERIKHFDTQMPVEVTIIHFIETDDAAYLERCFHEHHVKQNFKGEWFNLSEVDVDTFKSINTWRTVETRFNFKGEKSTLRRVPPFIKMPFRMPNPKRQAT